MRAIARVSDEEDWRNPVKAFVKLHIELLESYRDSSWSSPIDPEAESVSLKTQVERKIARIELALARAEQRREWAIVDLVYERESLRRERESR
jgi:hypothetical protein